MRLAFSDDHVALQVEFERFWSAEASPARARAAAASACGWDQPLWQELAALGWLGVAIGEPYGGLGEDSLALCLIAEAVGRRLAALPYASAVLGFAETVRHSGEVEAAKALLPGVVAGDVIGALVEPSAWRSASLKADRFFGEAPAVPDGYALTHLMTLVGQSAEARLIVVDLADAERVGIDSLDRINLAAALRISDAPVRILARGVQAEKVWREGLARYAIHLAFVQIGGAEAALNASRDHVLQRYAFGRPLGSFQAIKHGLANVLAAIEVGRSNAWFAAASLNQTGDTLLEAAAAARVSATKAHRKAARALVHYLGALGVTEEGDAQLIYRKAQALGMSPGTPKHWRERFLALAIGKGEAGEGGNLNDTPEEGAFRAEVRAWIAANRPPTETLKVLEGLSGNGSPLPQAELWTIAADWNAKKYDAGYGVLTWPKTFGGRDASNLAAILAEEEGVLSRLQRYLVISQFMCAATLMALATEDQKSFLLPRIARADDIWCQMFSEPGAGSDLAAVRTRAKSVDKGWTVNGQKVWTSGAHRADWGTLLARTNPDAPKHKGLTMFFLRMDTPGVRVRPIHQMTGEAEFNEVFFDDVFIPDEQRLGDVDSGWKATVTTLNNERMAIGAGLDLDPSALLDLARSTGAIDDPDVRQRIAGWMIEERGIRNCALRQSTALSEGRAAGPEAATIKLVGGVMIEDMAAYALDMLGSRGLGVGADDEALRLYRNMFYFGPAQRAAGGSDEVLMNVLAERVLGLPMEDRPDNRLPFSQIPTAKRD